MTFGPQAKKIVEAAKERGLPPPDSCLPPVVLSERGREFFDAFWELSSTRQITIAGAGPIPWQVMDAYAQRREYVEDEVLYDDFMHVVRGLDEEFLALQADEQKQLQAKALSRNSGGRSKRGR